MPFSAPTKISSPTGASLTLYSRAAEGKARGVIQINHGLAEHAARYGRFADFMAAKGFHVFAHGHRGHGGTTAPDAPPRMFGPHPSGEKVIADVDAVHAHIAEKHSGLPVITFGHSMGGLIALNHVLKHPSRAKAAAIWNANFTTGATGLAAKTILAWEKFRLGSDVPSRLLPKLTFQAWGKQVPGAKTEFDWLSRDPDEVAKYIADPLCGWDASVEMWIDLFGFVYFGADDSNFTDVPKSLPFNLVGGEKDPATFGGKAVRNLETRLKRMGFSNLKTTVYADTRHESLNELNRDMIMEEFANWAQSVCK